MLKDYSKSKARFDANYPQSPVHVYEYTPSDSDIKEIKPEYEDVKHVAHLTGKQLKYITDIAVQQFRNSEFEY